MQDYLSFIHGHVMDADRIPILCIAIVITIVVGMITGPLAGNANPFIWGVYDRLFGRLGDQINKSSRPRGDLIFRGFLLTSVMILLSFALSNFLAGALLPYSALYESIIISLCLTSGSVWYIVLKLYFALDQAGNIEGAYYGLSRSSRVDLNSVDDYGIARVGLSFSAIAFDKGMVAPALWYLIGGLPLLFIYSALSFTVWRFGRFGFSKGFGAVPLALEKLMGFVPSLFSGFLYASAAGVTPSAKISKIIYAWWERRDIVPYEQHGPVLSAFAWPLQISLGGPVRDIKGMALSLDWIGEEGASAQVDHNHLRRGMFLNIIALTLLIISLLCAYIYAGRFF